MDYRAGVVDCELGPSTGGRVCGAFKGELGLKNEGRACWGFCNRTAGHCVFCGTGQCCRRRDGEMCVPGCELASALNHTRPVCGNFQSEPEACTGGLPAPPPSPPQSNGSNGQASTTPSTLDPSPTELLNEGVSCGAICKGSGERSRGGDCLFCGTGQCCANIDWYRGVPGCEKAEGFMQAVCGDFREPYPEPDEFRLDAPLGTAATPPSPPESSGAPVIGWIRDIEATKADDVEQAYAGAGGKPWNTYEMALARNMIVSEVRRASRARDEISSAKFLRLAFHDCLRHAGGGGGCDGCLNWTNVGFEFEGRVEDREHMDFERRASNNGLQHVVAFLEYVYNYDFGLGSSCWGTGNVVGNFRISPTSRVKSLEECQQLCQNTPGCAYFQVPKLAFLSNGGPCWLSREGASLHLRSEGNLVAGHASCANFSSSSWSLKSRGKSRADLWAFASLVAIEEAIERNNKACDGGQGRGGIPGMPDVMCLQFEGEPQCKIWPSRPFVFKTGRKDCATTQAESYMAEEEELHPDEHFNGSMTLRFMEEHFGFSGKETVAIMGAHTLGKFHQRETGHKYLWTTDFQAFSNQYFRNIAGRPDYFFDDTQCTKVGDAWGNRAAAVWIAKQNQAFKSGGPVQWIKKQVACPNCVAKSYERGGRHPERLAYDRDCCLNKPPEAFCRPDGGFDRPVGGSAIDFDDDFSWGCEYSHFIFGRDETALSVDMGLMYKFDVDLKGFPSGCPGLGGWGPSTLRWSDYDCGIDGRPWLTQPVNESVNWTAPRRIGPNATTRKACSMACPKNKDLYPGDTMSLSEHVERFADDQGAWIEEFLPAMEKMISNGYGDELVVSWPPQGASLLAAARAQMRGDDA
eukprot:TRINITY_DN12603_c0_g2_i1.p1 TRINITY_DN12603_c0_g2~~TRINITY_DN12603_c0_g2_i1.p1  ORF type:complete len:980 (-),score=132.53 TRINITY_DN12603_c0_g2_i1:112-2691(-)